MPIQKQFEVNAQIEPTPVQDVYGTATAQNKFLSNLGRTAASIGESVLEEQGIQAAKSYPKEYLNNGTPISPIAIAEREAAIQSQQATISTDITTKVQALHAQWSNPKSAANPNGGLDENSFANFQKSLNAWSTSYFQNMLPVFKEQAKNQLALSAGSAQVSLLRDNATIIQNKQKAALDTATQQNGLAAQNLAFSGNIDAANKVIDQLDNHWKLLTALGKVSSDKYYSTMAPLRQKVKMDGWQGKIQKLVSSGNRLDAFDQINSAKKSGELTPLESDSLEKYVNEYEGRLISRSSESDADLDRKMSQNLTVQLHGGNLDSNIATQALRSDPEHGQNYLKASMLTQDTATARSQLEYSNFALSQSTLNDTKVDPSDPDFVYKTQKLEALKSYLNNARKQFYKDPALYTENSPSVLSAVDNIKRSNAYQEINNSNDLTDNQKQLALNQLEKQTKINSMASLQRAMGATEDQLSVLTQDDRQTLGSLYSTGDPKVQQDLVDNIVRSYGSYSNVAIKDLAKLGVPSNVINLYGLNSPSMINSAILLPTIYSSLNTPTKLLHDEISNKGMTPSDFYSYAQTALGTYFQTVPNNTVSANKHRSSLVDTVARGAMGYALQNNLIDAKLATKEIANAIIYNRYSGISGNARIPSNISLETARNVMLNLNPNMTNVEFEPLNRINQNDERAEDIARADKLSINNGHWATMTGDRGLYWVDANGISPIVKGTGKRYEFEWSDSEKPGSKLNIQLQNKHILSRITKAFDVTRYTPKFKTSNKENLIDELKKLNKATGGAQ